MKAPRKGYGKDYAVKWTSVTGETMYFGATTKEGAERMVKHGSWHAKAAPEVVRLK